MRKPIAAEGGHAHPSSPSSSSRKLRSSVCTSDYTKHDMHVADDNGSTTSNSDHASYTSAAFADAPLSPPPSSAHSSGSSAAATAAEDIPTRPAYLYLEGQDAEPPAEPQDDIKGVPVFTPTWEEFKDFYAYCSRIDEWGMRAGIVKIIPPKEWTDSLPRLDGRSAQNPSVSGERYTVNNRLSQVRIKNSIEQIFTPSGPGVWRQSNVVHPGRIVNAKQWADICAHESQRGPEMQRMKQVAHRKEADEEEDGVRTRSGRGRGSAAHSSTSASTSSNTATTKTKRQHKSAVTHNDDAEKDGERSVDSSASQSKLDSNSSIQAKPKKADRTTQEEWDQFDYINDWCKEAGSDAQSSDWSMGACRAIEQEYWRGLNYGKSPMYGADLSGTLFTSDTQHWNIGKLDNILTRLRLKRKLPGVTTPYLYFGMWRATFAWHVEDMDLYSINYIHFGAPKQWYAIRQADKQRFELAMASAFPADSSRCRHFMRHKSYLASPAFLKSAAGSVKPLRVVQKAQEIILTYPYGYHSGYNLGFNCAESVNFALERWLDIGRKAGYCDCSSDAVKMDVDAMLEESKEMEELERRRVERERKREEEEVLLKSGEERAEARREKERERRKRKKEEQARLEAQGLSSIVDGVRVEDAVRSSKKAKLEQEFPCVFCVSMHKDDMVYIPSSSDDKEPMRKAHRLCASFLPETWIAPNPKTATKGARAPKEVVMGFEGIPRARWSLKCQTCTDMTLQKRGAKVQCTFGRCSRTSHVGCALVEESGWLLDVLPDAEADAIEGKVNGKPIGKAKGAISSEASIKEDNKVEPTNTRDADVDDDNDDNDAAPRMVVLCRTHNPREREREARRKSMVTREYLCGLAEGDTICIRKSSAMYETLFVRYEGPSREEDTLDDGEVVLIDGSRIKGGKVFINDEAWRKADDARWYREEAKAQRLEQELKRKEKMTSEAALQQETQLTLAQSALQDDASASKIDNVASQKAVKAAEKARKAEERAEKAAERMKKEAERQAKREERERAKIEKERRKGEKRMKREAKAATKGKAGQSTQTEPLMPPQDGMQYIRDWKPREVPASAQAPFVPSQSLQMPPPHAHGGGYAGQSAPMPFTTPNFYSQQAPSMHQHFAHPHPSYPPLHHQGVPWHAHYGTLPDRRGMGPGSGPGLQHGYVHGQSVYVSGMHQPPYHHQQFGGGGSGRAVVGDLRRFAHSSSHAAPRSDAVHPPAYPPYGLPFPPPLSKHPAHEHAVLGRSQISTQHQEQQQQQQQQQPKQHHSPELVSLPAKQENRACNVKQ